MAIDQYLGGKGLVIGARARLDVFSLSSDVRFVDACDLVTLRTANPTWRSVSLAPVEMLDPTGKLAEVADDSVDFVIDWTMLNDPRLAVERLNAAARVLRAGGLLVLPVCDSRFVQADDEAEIVFAGLRQLAEWLEPQMDVTIAAGCWPLARFAMVMGALSINHAPRVDLEQVQRHGRYNLALFRRCKDAPIKIRSILYCEGDCYVLDAPFIRHITSMDTLNQLQAAGVPLIEIGMMERTLFVSGPPFGPSDVAEFLAKTDALR